MQPLSMSPRVPPPPTHRRTAAAAVAAAAALLLLLALARGRSAHASPTSGADWLAAATAADAAPPPGGGAWKKAGAGVLVVSAGPDPLVLLLQRKSKHHDADWGLPGGNVEDGESLSAAAAREAREEMGGLPSATLLTTVDVTRGEKENKFYRVFVARAKEGGGLWTPPRLDTKESRDYAWFSLADAATLPLHPVAAAVLKDGREGAARVAEAVAG